MKKAAQGMWGLALFMLFISWWYGGWPAVVCMIIGWVSYTGMFDLAIAQRRDAEHAAAIDAARKEGFDEGLNESKRAAAERRRTNREEKARGKAERAKQAYDEHMRRQREEQERARAEQMRRAQQGQQHAPRWWWAELGIAPTRNEEAITAAFRERLKIVHPQYGGTDAAARQLIEARAKAMAELRGEKV